MIPEYGSKILIQELKDFKSEDELKIIKETLEDSSNRTYMVF